MAQLAAAARSATGKIIQPRGKPAFGVGAGRVGVATSGVADGACVGLAVAVGRGVCVGPTVAVGRGAEVARRMGVGAGAGMSGTNEVRPRRSNRT